MSKSSINIQKVSAHGFLHNDRTESKTAKTVKPEHSHKNEYSINAIQAKSKYDNLYSRYLEKAKELKTRSRVKKENALFEAVVNIKDNTTMEDLVKVQKHIEDKFGFTGLQISIHKDEGYYDKNNNEQWTPNLHAHLNFFTINQKSNKQMMRRELVTRVDLRDLQTEVANILDMERGVDKRISKTERLNHKDYAQSKKAQEEQKHIQSKKDIVNSLITAKAKILQKDLDQTKKDIVKQKELSDLVFKYFRDHVVNEKKILQKDLVDLKKDLDLKIKESEKTNDEKRELYKANRELLAELKDLNKAKELSSEELISKIEALENEIYLSKQSEFEDKIYPTKEYMFQVQNAELQIELESKEKELLTIVKNNELLEEQNNTLKESETALNDKINDLESNSSAKIEKAVYEQVLQENEDIRKINKNIVSHVEKTYSVTPDEKGNIWNNLKSKFVGMMNKIKSLTKKVEDLEYENIELETKNLDLKNKNTELEDKNKRLSTLVSNITKNTVAHHQKQKEDLNRKISRNRGQEVER